MSRVSQFMKRMLLAGSCGLVLLGAVGLGAASWVQAQSQPARGGILTLVEPADPQTLGAVLTSSSAQGYATGQALEALLGLDWKNDVLVPTPSLAESWTVSPDGLTYTLFLVRNARWHDGVPFISADVKFTFQELTSELHPVGRTMFQSVKSIDTPDKHTVVLQLTDPFPALLLVLNQDLSLGFIMPKHLYENTDYVNNPPRKLPTLRAEPRPLAERHAVS
jgi:peptide/nickel transport system substrate-binding protein